MLRPLLAFACLALTAFLLAPTVQSVHEQVEALDIKRELPRLWKWDRPDSPPSLLPNVCDDRREPTYSEVDKWPTRIRKNETFTVGGFVKVGNDAKGRGLGGVTVEVFLNETKELPGDFLGRATTDPDGRFTLQTSTPFELQATKYHLVAHAFQKREGCVVYDEHWSDPEMEVTSSTRIILDPVKDAVAGRPFLVTGRLVDQVDAPVRNAEVRLTLDGIPRTARTDGSGRFVVEHNVSRAGTYEYSAKFSSTKYYTGSSAEGTFEVAEQHLRLDASSLDLVRSRPTSFSGRLVLPPGETPKPLTLTLRGVNVSSCEGCPASSRVNLTPGPDGAFAVQLLAGPDQAPGPFNATVTGGDLEKPRELSGRVVVALSLSLETRSRGPVTDGVDGSVRLVDETGRPWPGAVAVESAGLWSSGTVDAAGDWTFSLGVPCGVHRVRAVHNGTAETMPASAEQDARACPLLASLPPWLLATPWWAWLLLLLVPLVAWWAWRRWRAATAPVLTRGPPLTLSHTGPRDAAAGIVGVGERAVLTAFLEEPLPEGHSLRMGFARRTEPVEVGPDLRAEWHVLPDRLGEVPVRAEVLDKRGRVVTRRTAVVRVVRYAEEIESRYRRLRGASGAAETVSPREFEAWLRERSPDLDPAIVARLVGLFEEADYGPRDAGRPELVAYMEAEASLPEVAPRAALA